MITSITRLIYDLWGFQISRSFLFTIVGFLIFGLSCVLAWLFYEKLKSVDMELIDSLSGKGEARAEFNRELAIYPIEKGISADAIISFTSTKDKAKKVILEERKSDKWAGKLCLPGGHSLVCDNDLKATLSREVEEETPLKVDPSKFEFLGIYDKKERDERYVSVCYYVNMDEYPALNEAACKLENNPVVPKKAQKEVRKYLFLPLNKDSINAYHESFAFQHDKILLDFIDKHLTT